jgi:hypothetical protein
VGRWWRADVREEACTEGKDIRTHCHDRCENVKRKLEDLEVRTPHLYQARLYSTCCRGFIIKVLLVVDVEAPSSTLEHLFLSASY